MDIRLTANAISSDGELARTVVKAFESLDDLSQKERIRFHFWMVVSLRSFEATYVQGTYGSIDQIRIEGFKRSILSLISYDSPAERWNSSKTAFSSDFIKYADDMLINSLISKTFTSRDEL